MIQNRIKEKRQALGMTQRTLAIKLPNEYTALEISVLENGKALPTKECLDSLCSIFECTPFELYCRDSLDILGLLPDKDANKVSADRVSDQNHTGMVEFRAWLKPEEKDLLEDAIDCLGYRSMTEWFREAYRSLIGRAIQLKEFLRNQTI